MLGSFFQRFRQRKKSEHSLQTSVSLLQPNSKFCCCLRANNSEEMPFPRIVVSPFLCIYFATAVLAWLVPLIVMGAARGRLARQQNDDQGEQQDDQEQEYTNNCRWWQWGCNSQYYDGDGDDQNQQQDNNRNDEDSNTPWWWFFASEEDQRRREESQSNNPAMVLVYIWALLLFSALVWFGYRQLKNGSDLYRVCVALAVFGNFSLMIMFLIGGLEGGVQTEGPELEEQGFYSQFGVMMFLTNLGYAGFAILYGVVFWMRARRKEVIRIDIDESDYKIHDEEHATTV
ncbi:hypothetical protein MPSEU_000876100 [Mayamaea pseudoterrestris]|nr:hypothetical protein MPSEU_000876100 [Mayamaea pseudoterrestris]